MGQMFQYYKPFINKCEDIDISVILKHKKVKRANFCDVSSDIYVLRIQEAMHIKALYILHGRMVLERRK
jgi:hypothetical protein